LRSGALTWSTRGLKISACDCRQGGGKLNGQMKGGEAKMTFLVLLLITNYYTRVGGWMDGWVNGRSDLSAKMVEKEGNETDR
jgi:hypothetical protein